jgi:hypothetical protein
MSKRAVRILTLVVLVVSTIGAATPAWAQDEPPQVPSLTDENLPGQPTPVPQEEAQDGMQKTAPENWADMTFEYSAIPAPEAPTATFTVNSTQDLTDVNVGDGVCAASNGLCTLRAAVVEANATTTADQINVPDGVYVLASQLSLTKAVTINGASQANTIIDGNYAVSAFYIAKFSGSNTIQNLTIRNAWNKSTDFYRRNGGGVYNDGTLTLRNVTVTGCRGWEGGGVYNNYDYGQPEPRILYLDNVNITGNLSTANENGKGGGGLFNGSRLNGQGVTLAYNHAVMIGGGFYNNSYQQEIVLRDFNINNNVALYGGGVMNDLSKYESGYGITLENGIVAKNRAVCCDPSGRAPAGGGVDNNEGIIRMTNVTIDGNTVENASSGYGYGGGIVNIQYMELVNVAVIRNEAVYGSAIYNGNVVNWGNQLSVLNVTISNNKVPGGNTNAMGGALFNMGNGRASILNTTITENWSGMTGGIRNHTTTGLIELKNTILSGNTDHYNAPDCSGGMTSLGSNLFGNTLGNARMGYPCTMTTQANDQINTAPSLGSLITFRTPAYHPLLSNSQAVDRGNNTGCPATDSKGLPRPVGSHCDVGADEYKVIAYSNRIYLPIGRR